MRLGIQTDSRIHGPVHARFDVGRCAVLISKHLAHTVMCMVHTYAHALYETLQHDRAWLMHMEACASRCLNASAHKGGRASFAGFQRSYMPRTDVGGHNVQLQSSTLRKKDTNMTSLARSDLPASVTRPTYRAIISFGGMMREIIDVPLLPVFLSHLVRTLSSALTKQMPAWRADAREWKTRGEG